MTIHAYTQASGTLPAYVNVSEHPTNKGTAVLTVRSQGENHTSAMPMEREQLHALVRDVQAFLDKTK